MTSPDQLDDSASTEQVTTTGKAQRRICSISWDEIQNLENKEYLIKGVLYRNSLAVIYGQSNSGKTFCTLDMVLAMARKLDDWMGKRVKPARVLYFALEGGSGLKNRINAYKIYHGMTTEKPTFRLISTGIDLRKDGADVNEILQDVKENGGADVIVIDTLSRALAGGNENASEDMTALIANLDRLREATKALVTTLHHPGKNTANGSRGHSSLLGAIDTEIQVSKDDEGIITAEVTKQRDGATGEKIHFYLKPVEIGMDEDGDPITSCVVIETLAPAEQAGPKLSCNLRQAKNLLSSIIDIHGKDEILKNENGTKRVVPTKVFRDALKEANFGAWDSPDTARRMNNRIVTDLKKYGIINTYGDCVWLAGQAGQ